MAGPGWKGDKPAGINRIYRCETEFGFAFYRTQLFNPADLDAVKAVQAGYKVQTLSEYLGAPAPTAAQKIDFPTPLTPEAQRTSPEFFAILSSTLAISDPLIGWARPIIR